MITAATYFLLEWCSSQVPVGTQFIENRSNDDVERFFSLLRFDNRENLDGLEHEINNKQN